MPHASFQRLPADLQQNVLDALDEEIRAGFQKSKDAADDESTSPETSRLLADNIVRSLALRNSFTGEEGTTARDLGIGTRS